MPYKLLPKNSKGDFCVQNTETGENKGCSKTRAMAVKHMRALYAVESGAKMRNKEISDFSPEDWQEVDVLVKQSMEDYTKETGEKFDEDEQMSIFDNSIDVTKEGMMAFMPYYGATSYDELDTIEAAEEAAREMEKAVYQLPTLVGNIMSSPEIGNKGEAIRSLADELASRIADLPDEGDKEKSLLPNGLDEGFYGDAIYNEAHDKAKRSDVSEADKKRAVAEYGNVTYADPQNKKYPIDTPEHIRAAWNYIHQAKNAAKYPDKGAAIRRRIIGAWKRKIDKAGPPSAKELALVEQFANAVKELISPLLPKEPELLVFKDRNDQWVWFARYSNNYRDRDDPPEIISYESHLRFADMVEKGLAPYPDAMLWHVPQWTFGKATWVGYDIAADGSVFALAAGTVNKGCEQVAEFLSKQKDWCVSHGMPPTSIKYDPSDPSVIIEHITKEISPLPGWAAANELTGFYSITKEAIMPIPEDKKKALIEKMGFPGALLEQIEQLNASTRKEAAEAGLDKKETDADAVGTDTAATETPPVETPAEETPAEDKTPAEETPIVGATAQDIISAVAEVLEPIAKQVKAITDLYVTQGEILATLTKEIATLKKDDEQKVKETIVQTPMAALTAMLAQRVVGNPSTEVGKEDLLAKSGPKETPPTPATPSLTVVPFINELMVGKGK